MFEGQSKSHDRDSVQMGGTPQRKEMMGIGVLATVCTAHLHPVCH